MQAQVPPQHNRDIHSSGQCGPCIMSTHNYIYKYIIRSILSASSLSDLTTMLVIGRKRGELYMSLLHDLGALHQIREPQGGYIYVRIILTQLQVEMWFSCEPYSLIIT
jgi:hypothetical protein